MELSLSSPQLAAYAATQMNTFFPDGNPVVAANVEQVLSGALERLQKCLHGMLIPRFYREGVLRFDHLQSDQYSMFLYLLGNEAWRAGRREIATKSFLLNKALHSLEVFYEIELPEVFWFAHAIGTVLGRAKYGKGFVVMQGCTVGNKGGVYPEFGERVVLCANSSVIGGCRLGNDVCVGIGSQLIDCDVPDAHTAVGREQTLRTLPKKSPLMKLYFRSATDHE